MLYGSCLTRQFELVLMLRYKHRRKVQIGFTFQVPAHLDKGPLNGRVYVISAIVLHTINAYLASIQHGQDING